MAKAKGKSSKKRARGRPVPPEPPSITFEQLRLPPETIIRLPPETITAYRKLAEDLKRDTAEGEWRAQASKELQRLNDIREGLLPPPWMKNPAAVSNTVSTEPPAADRVGHARRGPKPYDWELFKAKFYLLLDNDDVPAHSNINISDYASRLMTWGNNNLDKGETPGDATMLAKVKDWVPLWRRLKSLNK